MKNGLDVMLNKLQISEKEVVALKAEKQKLQHELKNTTNTSLASVKSKKNEKKSTITFVKSAANKNSSNSNEKLVKVLVQKQTGKERNATVKRTHLHPPSIQKVPRQIPNSHHVKSYKKVPPSPHGSHIFVLVVSTLDQSRSTLVPDSRRPNCQTGTASGH
ncbi:hypothetical protein Taro_006662 [Colocasia esculenta]|uniref:Uncharacterized protein n=1 Tax=Colocasia esculenta TaxID=4460 RepID=A0A843TT20_COLES|nr:hypothetical protein [Colocasia esculenta]